jgi:hypothetical protein
MNEGPPDEKRGAASGKTDSPNETSTGAGGRFRVQNTCPTKASQSLPSVKEAAQILWIQLPEYVHGESNEYGDGHNGRLNEATSKQVAYLRSFGIDARGADCGHASRVISALVRRQQANKPSFQLVHQITRLGEPFAFKFSWTEAREYLAAVRRDRMRRDR